MSDPGNSATPTGMDSIIVLLVDDQLLVAAAVRRSLAGYPEIVIHHCLHSREAVAQANQLHPTVILQDLVMPDVDGITQVTLFRSNPATLNTPIIILSTKEDAATKSDCFAAGANDYLIKLPDKVELAARIRYHSKGFNNLLQRDQAEKKRREMEIQLRQSQKLESVGQLAAGIAHEINTPIQYLGDNTRFLKEAFNDLSRLLADSKKLWLAARANTLTPPLIDLVEATEQAVDLNYLTEEIPKAIDQSLVGIERVAKIVLAMKEFSHPGNETKVVADLNKAVETTLTISRHEWSAVASVVTKLDPSLPRVCCLPGEINQVLLNLIVNAAHAIAEREDGNGTITIATSQSAGFAEIRITDTGTGIPEKIKDRVFDPFFTTKGVGKGTGQGLTIAHAVVVEKHGGTITFETQIGKGTTFVVRLPFQPTING